MSRKRGHTGSEAGRRWRLVAVGVFVLLAVVLVFSTGLLATPKAEAELAPDLTLKTLQGDFQLSNHRGEAVVLYFSFVG